MIRLMAKNVFRSKNSENIECVLFYYRKRALSSGVGIQQADCFPNQR